MVEAIVKIVVDGVVDLATVFVHLALPVAIIHFNLDPLHVVALTQND